MITIPRIFVLGLFVTEVIAFVAVKLYLQKKKREDAEKEAKMNGMYISKILGYDFPI